MIIIIKFDFHSWQTDFSAPIEVLNIFEVPEKNFKLVSLLRRVILRKII